MSNNNNNNKIIQILVNTFQKINKEM